MVIENDVVQVESFETTSQKAKRTPATHKSHSPAKLGRRALVEGTFDAIDGDKPVRPQRGWLSSGSTTGDYVYDNIGGFGSFLYVIDTGFLTTHDVSALF